MQLVEQQEDAIQDTVCSLLVRNQPIFKVNQVEQAVRNETGLEVKRNQVAKFMKKEMHLGYRQVRTVPVQCNTQRCLVLRQQYALKMLPLLESKKRVINIDESSVPFLDFRHHKWAPRSCKNSIPRRDLAPKVNMIVAIDT